VAADRRPQEGMGFPGFVVSDWGRRTARWLPRTPDSTWRCPPAVLQRRAPGGRPERQVTEATLNDKVSRILRAMIWAGLFDAQVKPDESVVGSAEHRAVAGTVAREAVVLLKNEQKRPPPGPPDGPLDRCPGSERSVARVGGGGSAYVEPTAASTPLEEVVARAGGAPGSCTPAASSPTRISGRSKPARSVRRPVGTAERRVLRQPRLQGFPCADPRRSAGCLHLEGGESGLLLAVGGLLGSLDRITGPSRRRPV